MCGHTAEHLRQRLGQPLPTGHQLLQRITDQRELIHRRLDLLHVATSQCRPDFCCGRNPLACLRQRSRLKAPEAHLLIIYGGVPLQSEGVIDRLPDRGILRPRGRGPGLCAEKQHVLQQALRSHWIALGQRHRHHQHARCHALGVDVHLQQAMGHGIEISCCYLPENAHRCFCLRLGIAQTDVAHAHAGLRNIVATHDLQHGRIQNLALLCVIRQRCTLHAEFRITQTTLNRPQVGRMHLALGIKQGLHITVLGEQGHRRNPFASQHGLQKLQQGKAGFFQCLDHGFRAIRWFLHIMLHGCFHGTQQQCSLRHAHHFQSPAGLVQMLLGHAQRAAVQRCQVRVARCLGFSDKKSCGLDGAVQRLADLLQHPCQWT